MSFDHDAYCKAMEAVGLNPHEICFTTEDKQRILDAAPDKEKMISVRQEIYDSINRVFRTNLSINHTNFRGLR